MPFAVQAFGRKESSLHAQLLNFFLVVLAVEDVPLLAAFEDGALLGIDLLPGGLIDSFLLIEEVFHDLAHFQPDGIAVFDEVELIHFGERLGDSVRDLVHFVAADSHSTALYLRTSSLFTLRNIS